MPRSTREIAYSDFNLDDQRVDEADPLNILIAVETWVRPEDELTLEEVTALCRGEAANEF